IVYLELLRRGYKVYYYKTSSNQEIDFVLEHENKIVELIQVSKTLENEKTKKREMDVFSKTIEELKLFDVKCTVISEDKSAKIDDTINMINILEWLL
ncbi:MAG: hypothetical protein QG560_1172, partial [Campylobacterota bacterium]|nr:hypothetical protein [Campylobacterota bacterium]